MEIAPFDNREGFIWMNGEFIKWNDAKCHVITQGLHYASAVFEGERAYKGKIFKSEEHTKRLFRSAEIVGIKIPYSQSQINEAKDELIKKMNFEDLPNTIPIFPLTNFIIFPEITVPLNIFEKRYLQMVDDCMKTNRLIGMIQPKRP